MSRRFSFGAHAILRVLLAFVSLNTVCTAQGLAAAIQPSIPTVEIAPEVLASFDAQKISYRLTDAETETVAPTEIGPGQRLIYFTSGPSYRAAYKAVMRDRNTRTSEVLSQRLTGTPLDWVRLGLRFPGGDTFRFERPLSVSPKTLSEAIKDGVDLQIIDLRSMGYEPLTNESLQVVLPTPSFPNAIRLLPHEVEKEMHSLSKRRWTILIDNGDRAAGPVADQLFRAGYTLTGVLEGGYPAWAASPDR